MGRVVVAVVVVGYGVFAEVEVGAAVEADAALDFAAVNAARGV